VPTDSPIVAVALPVTAFPVITSPGQDTIITPISGDVIVTGVGPPSQTIRVKTESGQSLATTTTDKSGTWIVHIARDQFEGSKNTIYAELTAGKVRSPSVTFVIKSETLAERIVRWWSQ
jgi:hypothetical protein